MKLPGKGLSWKQFGKDLAEEWKRDQVTDAAAALTYYAVLALFPFLLFLVALASVVIDPAKAQALADEASRVMPGAVHTILTGQLQSLGKSSNGGLLTIGVLGAIWAASGGMMALGRVLNTAYDVEEGRPFWKTRGIAILMTIALGVIGLIAMLIAVGLPAVAGKVPSWVGAIFIYARFPVAAVLMMFVWALLYWALPDVEQKFKFVSPGSVVAVAVWLLASWGFSWYVREFGSYQATYGALGGIIVLLVWMWLSSVVLILGAEINAVLEHRSPEGKKTGAKRLADKGEDVPKGKKDRYPRPPPSERVPPPELRH